MLTILHIYLAAVALSPVPFIVRGVVRTPADRARPAPHIRLVAMRREFGEA